MFSSTGTKNLVPMKIVAAFGVTEYTIEDWLLQLQLGFMISKLCMLNRPTMRGRMAVQQLRGSNKIFLRILLRHVKDRV